MELNEGQILRARQIVDIPFEVRVAYITDTKTDGPVLYAYPFNSKERVRAILTKEQNNFIISGIHLYREPVKGRVYICCIERPDGTTYDQRTTDVKQLEASLGPDYLLVDYYEEEDED